MSIKGLLIDFDDTLYDYERCHHYALSCVFASLTDYTNIDVESLLERYNIAKKAIHIPLHGYASSHNRLLYFQKMIEQLPVRLESPISLAKHCYSLYWDSFISHIKLFDDVIDLFKDLRKQGIKIIMVTDLTADVQFKKIQRLGLDNLFDYVVTSEEAGCEKPHPYIFELALRKANLLPEQVYMVGDSYNKDIVGASNMGIQSIWLNRSDIIHSITDQIKEIKQFNELRGYLL